MLEIFILTLKLFIPSAFSMLFRVVGLGYRNKQRAIVGISIYVLYMLGVPYLLIFLMGYDSYLEIAAVTPILGNLAVFIVSSDGFFKTCFLHMIQVNMVLLISILANAIRHGCGLSYPVLLLILFSMSGITFLIAMRFWAKPMRFMADHIKTGWITLLSIPTIMFALGILISAYSNVYFGHRTFFYVCYISLIELGFFLFISIFYRNICEIVTFAKQELNQEILQTEMNAQAEKITRDKQVRHDLRHHVALMSDYLENGDIQGAQAYLGQYGDSLQQAKWKEYCENNAANAVLRFYSGRIEAESITFTVQADIPQTTRLTAPELGSVLSNLLENAWEACKEIKGKQRYIAVFAQTDENVLRLTIKNSTAATVKFKGGMPESTKVNGGIGTRSVVKIVKEYNGMCLFKQKHSEFIVQIVLPI